MEHEGKALAADELDDKHHRNPAVASVHVRAAVTWLAIFPMVAVGMSVMGMTADSWPAILKALVLTVIVVPTTVYFAVPRLLILNSKLRLFTTAARKR